MQVVKRDGTRQVFDPRKIERAVAHAARNDAIVEKVLDVITPQVKDGMHVETIQDLVEATLVGLGEYIHAKHYIIYRQKRAELRALRRTPDKSAIADYTHISKYARHVNGRRELWPETVERVKQMHIKRFPTMDVVIDKVFDEWVLTKKVIPSARSLQFAGDAIELNNSRMYNCSFTFMDRPRAFQEMLYLLLSGAGCGFSVQRDHVKKLAKVHRISRSTVSIMSVEDSIEGWADALGVLMHSYISTESWTGQYIEFDYSNIRTEGSPLHVSGGKAPGHVPLKIMLENVRVIMDNAVGRQLKSIEIHDICCLIASAVLAGGIRRSSLISLFDPDDGQMMDAKTGEWYRTHPHRVMANNSAVFLRKEIKQDDFYDLFTKTQEYGEPGFFLTDGPYGCNPCAEIGLNPVIDGETGWAFCNLTEINGAVMESEQDFLQACRNASFIGTLQAAYTDFNYLGEVSRRIAEREALLGVSITGMMDNGMFKDPALLKTGAEIVIEANREFAEYIGIQPAARCTTVKPSGTLSLLLGCVGSGVHPHHARRYFRRVTANHIEPPFLYFKSMNPYHCEEKPNGDWVITFPVEAPGNAVLREEMTAVEFMNFVFHVYDHWVAPGTARPESSPGLTHNVSCTVTVRENEWDLVREHVWANRHRISAMAFLPFIGDKKYPFAPREAVETEADETRWIELVSRYRPVDWSEMREEEDNVSFDIQCEGLSCEIKGEDI